MNTMMKRYMIGLFSVVLFVGMGTALAIPEDTSPPKSVVPPAAESQKTTARPKRKGYVPPPPLKPGEFRKGPYMVLPNDETKMTLLWQGVTTPEKAYVEWGTTEEHGNRSGNLEESGSGPDEHMFFYTITDLEPGTRYPVPLSCRHGCSIRHGLVRDRARGIGHEAYVLRLWRYAGILCATQ